MTEDMVDRALELLPDQSVRKISQKAEHLKNQRPDISDYTENLSATIVLLCEDEGDYRKLFKITGDALAEQIRKTGACDRLSEDIESRIDEVIRITATGKEGKSIIRAFYCLELDWLSGALLKNYDRLELMDLISHMTAVPSARVRNLLAAGGQLRKFGLLEENRGGTGLELAGEFLEFLQMPDQIPVWENLLENDDKKEFFRPEDFSIRSDDLSVLKDLIASGIKCQIFFYGTPGTGKTELARSLVRSAGKKIIFIKTGEYGNFFERILALEQAVRRNDPDSVYIFDEADSFLNTQYGFPLKINKSGTGPDKSWINDFLDRNKAKIIWIANHTEGIEESVLRRFHFSLSFTPLSSADRYRLWERLIKGHSLQKFTDPEYLRELAETFPVNTAGIKSTLDLMAGIPVRKNQDAVKERLELLLRAKTKLLTGKEVKIGKTWKPLHLPEILETNVPVQTLTEEAEKHFRQRNRNSGLHYLFYGPPGTGKSQLLKEIGKKINKEIQVERASSLLNPYIGMTERNIRAAFEKAEKNDSRLLLAEVDTFLSDRAGAIRSYESSMVNEFLDAMDSFHGILACTTNRIDGMDPAALRRFRKKVEFRTLTGDNAALLMKAYLNKYFGKNACEHFRQDTDQVRNLTGLTPGDFSVVFENLRDQGISSIKPGKITQDLERELKFKSKDFQRKIGF